MKRERVCVCVCVCVCVKEETNVYLRKREIEDGGKGWREGEREKPLEAKLDI